MPRLWCPTPIGDRSSIEERQIMNIKQYTKGIVWIGIVYFLTVPWLVWYLRYFGKLPNAAGATIAVPLMLTGAMIFVIALVVSEVLEDVE